ncbi:RHS repeat domain-containing protein [[Flexibacter] sp. ATCC 35208]|uniref:RHS repeat domain-containing protein n=1 Tax=[Flexibacter] sp. ATCC 35208 TaxID=1936242 RepID=UPI0009F9C80F|nr:RHS repeat-associated core domain-containing protein [[Flexibacter] sp. ATCC 35208]
MSIWNGKSFSFYCSSFLGPRYISIESWQRLPSLEVYDFAISKHLVADLQAILPLRQWTHVVLQGQGLNSGDLAVYVNGVLCPLSAGAPAGGCGWTLTNTGSGFIYPENLSTLKHFRLYNRLLSGAEIAANAAVPCLGLSPAYDTVLTKSLSYWGRYNLPAVTGDGSTVEMQFSAVYPGHTLATSYGYQSLNGITQQRTPDAGVSSYWYDRLGRLVTSQNAEQVVPVNGGATGRYSYTKYDAQGRVIEVGEKSGASLTGSEIFMSSPEVFLGAGSDAQITRTFYDEAYAAAGLNQENLRKRVAATTYQDAGTTPLQASYYSYDQIGNVKTLWQQVQDLGVKRVDYQYDLVSGKVNKVRYQRGGADRFYYNYQYDAENRLTKAGSGIDSVSADGWEIMNPKTDAGYRYYLHGPLARMELGDMELVQGVDYAYTLQGWLKGVNGNYLTAGTDMGRDGVIGGIRGAIARDAYAYSLDYYAGDYKAIVDTNSLGLKWVGQTGDVMGRNLYNGNISRSTLALSKINSGNPVGYSYRYDQLNRLTAMRQHSLVNGAASWNVLSVGNAYKEDISYDGNGNILRYTRYGSGAGGKQLQMDSLKYVYARDGQGYLSSNRLTQVLDSIAGDPYTEDVSSQGVNNYIYDNIGNLIANVRDSIVNIKWTVYGKISGIMKGDGSSLEYRYDAGGNRVYKGYTHGGVTDKTWYVRDAAGNVLAVYGNVGGGSDQYWKEQHLYGSSRLGLWEPGLVVGGEVDSTWNKVGVRRYELVNHLGNVLVTVSDKGLPEGDHYVAEVMSAGDYYPFGMGMGDRKWSLGGYRYGFNGKENDNEVKGEGNEIAFEARAYDSRVGKFLSIDPLTKNYPNNSPYIFGANNPVTFIDALGMWPDWPGWLSLPDHAPTNTWEYMQAAFCDACQFVQEGRLTGWTEAGRYRQGVAYNATMSTLAGSINGNLSNYSFGLLNRSAESIGINDDYAGYYDNATLITTLLHGVSGGTGAAPRGAFASSGEAVAVNAVNLKLNSSTIVLAAAIKNKVDGTAREEAEFESLVEQNPDAQIWRERYLRDANGKIVKDPVTGTGRRIDFSVVMKDKVSNLVEVTSLTADKTLQTQKEGRIRAVGGTYIKAPGKKGILYPVQDIVTQFSRRK